MGYWDDVWTRIEGFFSEIPIIGGIIKADQKIDQVAKEDRMADLEAINIEKAARKEKNRYTAMMNQAKMDAEMNASLAEEFALKATQQREQGKQQAEQIKTKGSLTMGSQQAMLAATGQLGAGSATGLMEQTDRNIRSDVSTTLANSESSAAIYDEKESGYSTLATSLSKQAGEYAKFVEGEEAIDPEAEAKAYLDAYYGS